MADIWGAFKGLDLGEFKDIASITMFADYVVPAVLRHWGILTCSPTLATVLDTSQELTPGSEEEVEIRACSITAVEWLREYLTARSGKQVKYSLLKFTFCCYGNPSILCIRLTFFNFSEGKQHKENTVENHRFPWSLLILSMSSVQLVNCRDLLLRSSQLMNSASKSHKNG